MVNWLRKQQSAENINEHDTISCTAHHKIQPTPNKCSDAPNSWWLERCVKQNRPLKKKKTISDRFSQRSKQAKQVEKPGTKWDSWDSGCLTSHFSTWRSYCLCVLYLVNLTSTNFAFKWAFEPFARAMLVSCFLEVPAMQMPTSCYELLCPKWKKCKMPQP